MSGQKRAGSLPQVCGTDSPAARQINFDFCSLSGRGSANPCGDPGQPLATFLHSITPSVAIPKHFKQPYGLDAHLVFLGTGSPFLVDRKGKPKHNISVSVNPVEFGRQGGAIFHLAPTWSRCAFR
jgi:hypothetical protein